MALKRVRLPDNTVQDINDARISGIDSELSGQSSNPVENATIEAEFEKVTYVGETIEEVEQIDDEPEPDPVIVIGGKALTIPFGEVDSTSTSTVITATVDNFPTVLADGVCAYVRNNVVASASGWTLNINGTGAFPVYQTMADETRTSTIFNAESTYLFVYNSSRVAGGCWDLYYGYNSNTNTIGYQLRSGSYRMPMKSPTYRYRLLFTSADGNYFVPATNSSSSNATAARAVCQDAINPFGSIIYHGATTTVAAGSRPAAATMWQQYTITLGYSFNVAGGDLTLTSWKPVYVKCSPQSGGGAIIDASTPIVQDLPTTNDGYIYIFLGVAYAATSVELLMNHPVFYHDGIGIRAWNGKMVTYSSSEPSASQGNDGDVWIVV